MIRISDKFSLQSFSISRSLDSDKSLVGQKDRLQKNRRVKWEKKSKMKYLVLLTFLPSSGNLRVRMYSAMPCRDQRLVSTVSSTTPHHPFFIWSSSVTVFRYTTWLLPYLAPSCGVALVDGVDGSSRLALHLGMGEDELSDWLQIKNYYYLINSPQ